ncbi:MAG: hypothetical protein ACOX6T_20780 [Myxococcales bacterium]|jgi:hypothetical protein
MSRNYSSDAIIDLPRMSSHHALTLGSQVLNAIPAEQIPTLVQRPYYRVRDHWENLRKCVMSSNAPAATPASRNADSEFDQAWCALDEFLSSWSRLPSSCPQADKARALRAALYPDGRLFTKADYRTEWAEGEWRLAKLSEEANAALIAEIGGQPFVTRLRAAHQNLGEVLGMQKERPELRESLESFCGALRSYIMHVAVYAESEEPGAEELAEKLLAPVVTWKNKQARPRTDDGDAPEPQPEPVEPG